MDRDRSSVFQQNPIHVVRVKHQKRSGNTRRIFQDHHLSGRRQGNPLGLSDPQHSGQTQAPEILPNHHQKNRIPYRIKVLMQNKKQNQ